MAKIPRKVPAPLTPSEMGKLSRSKLTKRQRSEAARVAAIARWAQVRARVQSRTVAP